MYFEHQKRDEEVGKKEKEKERKREIKKVKVFFTQKKSSL